MEQTKSFRATDYERLSRLKPGFLRFADYVQADLESKCGARAKSRTPRVFSP